MELIDDPLGRGCPDCKGQAVTRGNCRCETCDGNGWISAEQEQEQEKGRPVGKLSPWS
jgi:hypothetical protein